MILPIGDEPNPARRPVVTWLLIATNVLVYLLLTLPLGQLRPSPADPAFQEYAQYLAERSSTAAEWRAVVAGTSRYDVFVWDHGFQPGRAEGADLLASMFLHGGLLHLLGNMLFLWIYGDNVEARLGRLGFLAAYLGTGAAATLAHAAFSRGSLVPMVGASGAISGVLGLYFLWFPKNRVKMLVLFFPFFVDVVRVPARLVLGFYVLVDNLLPLFFSSPGAGGVAYGAHLGGFFAGLALAASFRRNADLPAGRPAAIPVGGIDPAPVPASAEGVESLVHRGDLPAAARLYVELFRSDERERVAPGAVLAVARWYEGSRQPEVALAIYQRYLADHPNGPWLDRVHLAAGLLLLEALRQPLAARQHLLAARELTTDGVVAEAARTALRVAGN